MKKILRSPPKPTRTVLMNLPGEAMRSLHKPSTLSTLPRMPSNTNNVLTDKTQTSSAGANIDLPAVPHTNNTLRRVAASAMQISPAPAQIHAGLTDSSSSKTLTSTSDRLSPVKPQPPQSSTSGGQKSEASLESLLVDRAIEGMMSLPEVVGEVALKQKEQGEELRNQQQQLVESTQKLKEEEKKVETVKEELQSVKRQTWLMEEKSAQIKQQCRQLDSDIDGVIRRNTEVMRQVESKQEELERDGAVYQESVERMTQHVELVEALEKTCGHNKALEEERRKVKILRRQKQEVETNSEESYLIVTGACASRIQEDIRALRNKTQQVDNMIQSNVQQVESERERQSQLKQDLQVLQKRNAAQLTRLRRQLKKSQCHNRQWGERATQLERTVSDLKHRLEE